MADIVIEKDLLDRFIENPENHDISFADVAKALISIERVDKDLFEKYIQKIPNEYLGDIALELPEKYLKKILTHLKKDDLVEIVEELESDDATDLLQDIEEIDEQKAEEIFQSLDKEDQEDIKKLRKYDEHQAGAHMQTELFSANIDEKVSDAINRFRELKKKNELTNIHQIFITGTFNQLLFVISLEDLILLDFDKTFKEQIKGHEEEYKPIFVRDDDDIETVLQVFKEYDLSVVAVVNHKNELVGRITSDDIYDLIEENATEQIYNLAGVDDEAEEDEDLYEAGKKRAIWLFINLITAILASAVISLFDSTISAYVALAVLMPIVASMGGNAGTQTLTVTVRKLALGDIDVSSAKETIKRELLISLSNGLIFAIVMGVIALVWFGDSKLGFVIAASMVINLLFAGFFGALIPLILKRLNIDPAVGSTVLLTTITDVVGFFSFLGLAKIFLIG